MTRSPTGRDIGGQVVIEREQLVVQVGVAQQGVAHWGPPSSGQTKEGTPFTDLLSSSVRGSRVSPQRG